MKTEASRTLGRFLCWASVIALYLGTSGALRSQPNISNSGGIQSKAAESAKNIRMPEMTWPDIKSAIEQGYVSVVVAVSSTEQHGPHLPTMTDTRIGDEAAHRVAIKLDHTLQARTISVGCSKHHLAFPGTISLREETLRMIILTRNGVIGDPRKASADKGKVYLDRLTEFLIQEIKKQTQHIPD